MCAEADPAMISFLHPCPEREQQRSATRMRPAWKGGRVHGKDEASEGESVCQKGRSSVRNRTWEAPVMAIGCRAAQHAEALPGPWCPPAGELHLAMTPFEGSEFCTPALDELR